MTLQMLVTGLVALKADGFSLRFFQSHSIFPSCWIKQESKHSQVVCGREKSQFPGTLEGKEREGRDRVVLQHRAVLPISKTEMPTCVLLGIA